MKFLRIYWGTQRGEQVCFSAIAETADGRVLVGNSGYIDRTAVNDTLALVLSTMESTQDHVTLIDGVLPKVAKAPASGQIKAQ